MKKQDARRRGVFEKVKGSGAWWIRYADGTGKPRREIAGTKSNAISLYQKRKAEVLVGKKLPESLRQRVVRFTEIADDALAYCKANNQGQQFDGYRIGRLKAEFGSQPAEVPIEDLRRWFGEQEWEPGTHNRYKSTLSWMYRLAVENKKAFANPARLLKRKLEDNGRVRFLNQHLPAKTDVDYLKPHADEESRLRSVILAEYNAHMPEFEIAMHTGMRPSEQYGLTWSRVDLVRKLITLPKTKNGNTRHIPLNSVAFAAFQELSERSSVKKAQPSGTDGDQLPTVDDNEIAAKGTGDGRVFVSIHGDPLKGYKHWFDAAISEAGIEDFTWYCLRHTFASRLVMAGVDLRTVAELMGHKTIQMTMRYAHLAPAHKNAAVECLATAWKNEKPTDTRTDTDSSGHSDSAVR